MFGQDALLRDLAARKRLLVAESELNRAQFLGAIAVSGTTVRALLHGAGSIGSVVSSIGRILGSLGGDRRDPDAKPGAGPSWMRWAVEAAGLVSTAWFAFKRRARNRPPE